MAGPTGCTNPSSGVTDCEQNQTGGVSNSDLFSGTVTLNVQDLTTGAVPSININTSGPGGPGGGACSGGSNGTSGTNMAVTFDGSQSINATGAGTSGITVVSNGGSGGSGGGCSVANAGGGGGGGEGGNVGVTASGSITVQGANSAGIFAQSSGGSGGMGGGEFVVGFNPGSGGQGSNGQTVTINNTANITTNANNSSGIVVDSNGGSGGGGGPCGGLCFGSGGGGPTGYGGTISVTSSGTFTIQGTSNSYGIFAQSIGGSGGAGGGGGSFLGLAGWGANAQSGGNGGDITIDVTGGSISTVGSNSSVIYAQSVGGGGGAGGSGFGLFYASGSGGTSGGAGGTVMVTNYATLTATGEQSSGIYAQSIGGSGGAGGSGISPIASFGGQGGTGETGNTVTVNNNGNITVSGNAGFSSVTSATLSTGIFAQSVGGGGGDGGIAVAGLVNFGGGGGNGGTGGNVTVTNTATIQALCGATCTGGDAIFAQSVGGGGGNGGGAVGIIALGGGGGMGNDAGTVTVTNSGGGLTTTATFSPGIFAQSVGGGGGNGNFGGGIAGIGGTGGTGGIGQLVTVNNSASITTGASDSAGIFAQSVGGGGGSGGGGVGVGVFVSFAMGGQGGAGANAGVVCVNTSTANSSGECSGAAPLTPVSGTTIQTSDDRSTAILAESVGGGGGNGGFAVSASVGLYGDLSIGAGGDGGGGGKGGDVFVTNSQNLITGQDLLNSSTNSNYGQFSDGIDAESIGGGGGTGGFSVTVGVSTAAAATLSFGGAGGSGSAGGDVTVVNSGNITTWGDQAIGIHAESIGGGGGDGGFAIGVSGAPYLSISLSIGGSGGGGGPGGNVSVNNSGIIQTDGAQANGISAQSIGGSGGNGGFSVSGSLTINSVGGAISLGFGGTGGSGGTGGTVNVTNNNNITTAGASADGILAQSVGGGGGNGGFSGAIALSNGAAFSDAFGGNAGSGNNAGTVTVMSTGSITTTLDNSVGIAAQSIGGGGGNGGFSLSVGASLNSFSIGDAKAGVGGSTGYGNTVMVTSTGTIQTGGDLSYGILAQSIGGGGGNGGFSIAGAFSESSGATGNSVGGYGGSGNNGGEVTVTTNPSASSSIPGTVIYTTGTGAIGILAQSVGGGGGNGGFAADINASIEDSAGDNTLGGTGATGGGGGSAGNGNTVTVNNNGTITTTGNGAHGIVAQSIGGGGGNGGFTISGAFSDEDSASSNAIGGTGGGGGTGGQVIVTNMGNINVGGDMANGIIAQSIGGGGGNGGFSISAALSLSSTAATNSLGGGGGNGGGSSEVDVYNYNTITVGGAHSDGILAQSIGGGGGNGGFSIGAGASTGDSDSDGASDTVGGSGGAGGTGGAGGVVTVTTYVGSSVTTSAFMDNGIVAQSIGGGGGNGGFSITGSFTSSADTTTSVGGSCNTNCQSGGTGGGGGTASTVTVDNAGAVTTNDMNSIGILAQSIGGGGGSGGFAITAAFSVDGAATGNAIGGNGGNGGNGGQVTVTLESTGSVTANQSSSIGILAQSIGGGGGNGGFAIGGAGSSSSDGAANTIGGSGGNGGNGGIVTVTTKAGSSVFTGGADDFGIVAQSIGGGGGNGGFSIAGSLSLDGNASSTIGGSCNSACASLMTGGGGGTGNTVTVENGGTITTTGIHSIGIVAQSIGGGGGTGGFSGTLSVSGGGDSTSNSVGGSGGDGGAANTVTVTNDANALIKTEQMNSIGILAQSIGGGGGDGGFTFGAGVSNSGDAMTTAVGGSGGNGGAGGTVNVYNYGTITTGGANSAAIVAQSIGGGGGNGGLAVSGSLTLGGGNSGDSVGGSQGGSGGGGGNGGVVTVTNTGTIMVTKDNSVGIIAQSIGGGGGSAGFSGQVAFGGGSMTNQVGGTGGIGGNGGDVTVTSTAGNIIVGGNNSIAVLAQSIGGGGGNNGMTFSSNGTLSGTSLSSLDNIVGGNSPTSSADNGSKGTVTVTISGGGMTMTTGDLAYGLLAQAIGAGGGNNGLVVPDAVTIGDPTLQVGGNGATTGDGGVLSTSNANPTVTTGLGAVGLMPQSIGGGGGVNAIVATINASGDPFNVFVGGNASGGNDGGSGNTVTFQNTGTVTTTADNAIAVLTQSIGGGGGLGSNTYTVTGTGNFITLIAGGSQNTAGSGDTVTMTTFTGSVTTEGLLSEGVVEQSIGGGGGVATFVAESGIDLAANGLALTAGGTGGPGGSANTVTLNSTAPTITTTKAGAVGIVAQSIGGGGGIAQVYGASVTGSNTATLGAANGAAGNGGNVTVTSASEIGTSGVGAHGILAQSIGGGGGVVQAFDTSGNPINLSVAGGTGGGGGTGGAVSVNSSAFIMTIGAGADGIIAQSIGGGGGLVGSGAFALSAPGTGPFAGTVGGSGSGGTVGVTASANILTTGLNSTAIFAESLGGSGANAITVNVISGALITGGYFTGSPIPVAGNAIALVGGTSNTITNAGTLTTVSSVNGMTITGGMASNAVVNTNYVIGSVDLCLNGGVASCNAGTTVNSFDNRSSGGLVFDTVCAANGGTNCSFPGAIFDSGTTVYLGSATVAGNLLSNEGLISPGGYLNVATTNVTGNFTQSSTGVYGLDLNFLNQTTDLINITGTANVSGTVAVNIDNPALALPGNYQTTILAAAGDVTNHAGLSLDAIATAVAQYSLVYPNPNDIDLRYSINFSPGGLTINQHSVGNAVNAIQTARSSPNFAPIAAALFYQPTVTSLGQVYDSLSGEGTSGVEQTAFTADRLFMNSISQQAQLWLGNQPSGQHTVVMYADDDLLEADAQNPIFKALAASRPPTWRFWEEPYGSGGSVSGELPLGSAQLNFSGGGLALGTDYQPDAEAIVGLALGGNLSSFSVPDRATTGSVDGGQVAAYGVKRWQDFYATGIANFGFFTNSEQRFAALPGSSAPIVPVPGFAEQLNGDFQSQSFNARFEAGWRHSYDLVNVTPFAAVEYGLLHLNHFSELDPGGSDLLGLSYASHDVDSLPTFLGIQFDSMNLNPANPLSYWARLSWMHEFEPYRTIDASFLAAPGFDFVVNGAVAPANAASVDLGLKYALTSHLTALASFDGWFAPQGVSYAGTVGLQSQW